MNEQTNGNGKRRKYYSQLVVWVMIIAAGFWRIMLPGVALIPFVQAVRWQWFEEMAFLAGAVTLFFNGWDFLVKKDVAAEPVHQAAHISAIAYLIYLAFFGPTG